MLNVISCFVAAFCLVAFFHRSFLPPWWFTHSRWSVLSVQHRLTEYTQYHRAVQIDFCLNWSLVSQWKDTWTKDRVKRDFYFRNIQVLNRSVRSEEVEFSIFKRPLLETVTGGWIQTPTQLSTTHENSFTSTCAEVKPKFGECCQNISHTWKPF